MTTQDEPTTQGGTMPLLEHLTELRNRLGVCVLVFVILFIGCLVLSLIHI